MQGGSMLDQYLKHKYLNPGGALVRKIVFLTIALVFLHVGLGIILGYPKEIFWFFGEVLFNNAIVLILLRRRKESAAKIVYLSTAYLIIFCLTPIFGYELNTHLYLIPGVGMALVFFDQEIGKWRWLFVLAGLPVWLTIEWWGRELPVIISVPDNLIKPLGQMNIALTLMTSFFMFYIFTMRLNRRVKELEEEKLKAEKSVNRLKQFNNILIHDLKSPLNTISSMTDVIVGQKDISREDIDQYLVLLRDKATASRRLVEGITTYFKETRTQPSEWVDLKAMLKEVLSLLTVKPNFEIVYKQLPDLYLSPIAIRQLIQNMVTNAMKYNDSDKGLLEIYYKENKSIGSLCFKDNGVGMTEEQQKRAFELFTLFHNMAQEHSSGMGLAISKELVENNGGSIKVSSVPGKGSEFCLCFPKDRYRVAKNQ